MAAFARRRRRRSGVLIYFHDWFGAGRTAMVKALNRGIQDAIGFGPRREDLTGDQSRMMEVKGM